MNILEGNDEEIVAADCNDVGNLAFLCLESPAGNLLGVIDGTKTGVAFKHIVHRMGVETEGVNSSLECLILAS